MFVPGEGSGEHNSYRKRFLFFLKVAEDSLLSGTVKYFLHDYHLRVGALSGINQIRVTRGLVLVTTGGLQSVLQQSVAD